jgi:hypothetical protein
MLSTGGNKNLLSIMGKRKEYKKSSIIIKDYFKICSKWDWGNEENKSELGYSQINYVDALCIGVFLNQKSCGIWQ